MSAFATTTRETSPWLDEAKAMLALSWPMVLTNIAQTAMTATDVVMMGHLSPEALAAGALGANLYMAVLIFGIGMMAAVPPMISIELGRNRHAVRDVRRTVRQGLWTAVTIVGPMWLFLWQAEAILRAMGQDPALSRPPPPMCRRCNGGCCLSSSSRAARLHRGAAAPVRGFGRRAVRRRLQRAGQLVPDVRALGFPALGLPGSGLATTLSSLFMFVGMAVVVTRDRRFRRFQPVRTLLAAGLAALPRLLAAGIADRHDARLRGCDLQRRGHADGLARPDIARSPRHRDPDRLADLHGADGHRPGRHSAGRPGLRRRRQGGHRAGRQHGDRAGPRLHGLDGAPDAVCARVLVGPFLDIAKPGAAEVAALAMTFLLYAAIFQIADGAQVVGSSILRGLGDTRVPMIFAGLGYWAIGLPLGRARLLDAARRRRHLDRARGRADDRRRADARALACPRQAGARQRGAMISPARRR
jgi:MATE family multidrug resistance protein